VTKRQTRWFAVSTGIHAVIVLAVIALCGSDTEQPAMVVDFSILKPANAEAAILSKPLQRSAQSKPVARPSVPEPQAFPDSARPDTMAVSRTMPVSSTQSDTAPVVGASDPQEAAFHDSAADQESMYLRANYGAIRDKIYKRLSFPEEAIERGWQGKLQLAFCVRSDGRIDSIRVVASSGHVVLDESAIDAVKRAGPYPKSSRKVEIRLPISYRFE